VMRRSRFLKYRLHALVAGLTLLLVVGAQIFVPSIRDFSLMVAWGLTSNVVDLGEGWLAWIASPVNTVGSVIVFGFKGVLMLRKRVKSGFDWR
jgi:hypothetical protein